MISSSSSYSYQQPTELYRHRSSGDKPVSTIVDSRNSLRELLTPPPPPPRQAKPTEPQSEPLEFDITLLLEKEHGTKTDTLQDSLNSSWGKISVESVLFEDIGEGNDASRATTSRSRSNSPGRSSRRNSERSFRDYSRRTAVSSKSSQSLLGDDWEEQESVSNDEINKDAPRDNKKTVRSNMSVLTDESSWGQLDLNDLGGDSHCFSKPTTLCRSVTAPCMVPSSLKSTEATVMQQQQQQRHVPRVSSSSSSTIRYSTSDRTRQPSMSRSHHRRRTQRVSSTENTTTNRVTSSNCLMEDISGLSGGCSRLFSRRRQRRQPSSEP